MSEPASGKGFPQVVHITSETCELARVREAVLIAAGQIGFSGAEASSIALAIDEAITNVIRHGYDGCGGQPIEIALDRVERDGVAALQVTICDCGRQVDPATIVGRDLGDVRPGGLGTHIIRTVMDEVEYSMGKPAGMRLRVLKRLGSCRGTSDGSEAPCSKENS